MALIDCFTGPQGQQGLQQWRQQLSRKNAMRSFSHELPR